MPKCVVDMISIKSDREIDIMRDAGKILGEVHNLIADYVKPGLSTKEVDDFAARQVAKMGGSCSFYHLYDFPGNFCLSLNDEVIHGIPSSKRILKDGDVLKVDGGVCYKGFHSDAARTIIIGKVSDDIEALVERTKQAFFEGISAAVPGNHIIDISSNIDNFISQFGYGIVEDFVGHGIGSSVHEDPDVPNFTPDRKGPLLRKNMTLAVEPMINLGTFEVFTDKDEWTVKTKDHKCSAHYENTILITDNGPEILSLVE